MTQWVKTLSASLCIITILLHLIPQGKFVKYVRFYAGLLFFLIAAGPVLQIFTSEGELERLLQLEFLKEEYNDLEIAMEGMDELRSDTIEQAYQQEILRQIEELASAYGMSALGVGVNFASSDGISLQSVTLDLPADQYDGAAVDAFREELTNVYMLEPKNIFIHTK